MLPDCCGQKEPVGLREKGYELGLYLFPSCCGNV